MGMGIVESSPDRQRRLPGSGINLALLLFRGRGSPYRKPTPEGALAQAAKE